MDPYAFFHRLLEQQPEQEYTVLGYFVGCCGSDCTDANRDFMCDIPNIKYMIEAGMDPRVFSDMPFIMSCRRQSSELAVYFINYYGVDINAQNGRGMIEACKSGSIEVIRMLLEQGSIVNLEALKRALLSDKKNIIIKLFLENNVDANLIASSVWEELASRDNEFLKILRLLSESDIYFMSGVKNIEKITHESAHSVLNIDINRENQWPWISFYGNKVEIFDQLLDKNTGLAFKFFLRCCESDTSIDNIKYMINKGADPRSDDDMAFILSCRRKDPGLSLYLLEKYDIDINAQDSRAMLEACIHGSVNIIKILFERGCQVPDGAVEKIFFCHSTKVSIIKLFLENDFDVNLIATYLWKNIVNIDRQYLEILTLLADSNIDFRSSVKNINEIPIRIFPQVIVSEEIDEDLPILYDETEVIEEVD